MLVDLDAGLGEKLGRQRVVIIRKNDHAFNAGGDHGLGAGSAGHVGHVSGGAVDWMSAFGRLDDRVHFGMNGAHAMVVHDQTTDLFAMLVPGN